MRLRNRTVAASPGSYAVFQFQAPDASEAPKAASMAPRSTAALGMERLLVTPLSRFRQGRSGLRKASYLPPTLRCALTSAARSFRAFGRSSNEALQSIRISHALAHPTKLVQPAAMASVAPPKPSYRPPCRPILLRAASCRTPSSKASSTPAKHIASFLQAPGRCMRPVRLWRLHVTMQKCHSFAAAGSWAVAPARARVGRSQASCSRPSLIRLIERDFDAGHVAVIQIVSTGEALMERRLAEIPTQDWGDVQVDITPRAYVLDYLAHSFPVHLYPFTDSEGNLCSRPVYRDGQPVESREAVASRERLIEKLASLAPVPGALDQIVQRFGTYTVAGVTRRARRIVRKSDRLVVETEPPRPSEAVSGSAGPDRGFRSTVARSG